MTPERKNKLTAVLEKRQPDLAVVMENVFDPHNIAAVMRSCDAVGVQDIYIIHTRIPTQKKWGARTSSSAKKWLSIHTFEDVGACFRILRARYDAIYTTCLEGPSEILQQMDFTRSVALIFGNEKTGVSAEACRLADANFIIPQVGMIRSLNISVACAVTLYEAYRQKSLAGHYDHPKLQPAAMQTIKKQWKIYEED